jgi:hypothetical protein
MSSALGDQGIRLLPIGIPVLKAWSASAFPVCADWRRDRPQETSCGFVVPARQNDHERANGHVSLGRFGIDENEDPLLSKNAFFVDN